MYVYESVNYVNLYIHHVNFYKEHASASFIFEFHKLTNNQVCSPQFLTDF